MAEGPFILALDQGTTSSRALLVDSHGEVVRVAAEEFRQHYPAPGWVEHDPQEIWNTQLSTARRVLAEEDLSVADLAGVGITNQRETTLLWRRSDGMPVHPAIVWQDRRTAARCEALRNEGRTEWLQEKTGLVPDPYFSATKLEWLLDHVEGARGAAEDGELAFGTVDTWLMWQLSEGHAHRTERTNASRTLLWNLREERWDPELLDLFRIPEAVLPEVLPSVARFDHASALAGLGNAPPIFGVAGDQQAALFGQAGWEPGTAKNTYGTGCFLLLNTGANAVAPQHGLLSTAAAGAGGSEAFALEGSVFVAGAAVQWLRDELGLIREAAETELFARSVDDTGGVYLVPAFAGLGTPYWDPRARGAIVGLTRGSGRAQIVRAALESIAYQTCDVVDAMRASGCPVHTLRVDGGACPNDFLMQLQADLLGVPVERAAVRETTALGAAYLAGLGCGLWTPSDLGHLWKADRVFEPAMSADQRETLLGGWRRAVERARDWA